MTDLEFMERALALARHGLGNVSPNPLVGAVLVKQGRVVGEGFHLYQQVKHAEVVACEQAGQEAAGATLYLNLEPCAHQGRTGPCCDYLIGKRIARVVAAMEDPHPLVSGRGFERLREAGVRVEVGLMGREAAKLNESFAKFAACGLPFVTIKSAMSLDGKITGCVKNQREYFSGPESNAGVDLLRLQVDAVAVGAETVLADNPQLTYRGGKTRRRPLARILLDPRGRVPLELRLFKDPSPVWWVRPPAPDLPPHVSLIEPGPDAESTWNRVLKKMAEQGMYHLLIEGGGETNAGALRAGIVDKILWIYAPKLIGGNTVTGVIGGAGFSPAIALKDLSGSQVGQDFWLEAYLAK